MSRAVRWAGVMGLAMAVLTGCHALPRRLVDGKPGGGRVAREVGGGPEGSQSRLDKGVFRTRFEREDPPSRADRSAPSDEVDVPAEQRIGVHLDLGRVLESQDRPDAALGEYRKAVEAYREVGDRVRGDSEEKADLHRKLARAFDHLGLSEEAKSHYRTAQKKAPRDPKVWNDAGYSAFFQGRFEEAEGLLRKAAKLDPANPRILTNLGMALAAEGKVDPALEVLTKASGPLAARMNLAYVLASTGQADEARKQYRAVLATNPDLELARKGLAKLAPETPERTARTRPDNGPPRRSPRR